MTADSRFGYESLLRPVNRLRRSNYELLLNSDLSSILQNILSHHILTHRRLTSHWSSTPYMRHAGCSALRQPPARRIQGVAQFCLDSSRNTSSVEGTVDEGRPVHHTAHMNAITYTAARENLASTMDRVCNDHSPVIITRNRDQSVVMLSLEDFEALEETAYLLRSPANAKRLLESIHSLENGQGITRSIDLNS